MQLTQTCSRDILVAEKTITSKVAWPVPEPVAIAVIVSCVGAALQCLAGAPQLLEAIADDDLVSYLSVFSAKMSANAKREGDDLELGAHRREHGNGDHGDNEDDYEDHVS